MPGLFDFGFFDRGLVTAPASGGGYFAPTYFAPTYFAPSYFPGAGVAAALSYLEQAIMARCLASAALAAVVGDRVYPVILPQTRPASAPALSFQTESDDEESHLSGASGIVRASVKFECRAPLQADAVALRELLRSLWSGFGGTVAGVRIHFARPDGRSTDYDEPFEGSGSDRGTHVSACSFRFTYAITPPTF